MTKNFKYFFILLSISLFTPFSLNASDDKIDLSKGQRVYVPAYSHIYSGNKERPFLLTVTLSIRNIDPTHLIKITLVDYYETQGNLLKEFINKPIIIGFQFGRGVIHIFIAQRYGCQFGNYNG